MPNTEQSTDSNKSKLILGIAILTSGWLFLWFAPWQIWLKSNLWLVVGIALVVFITPGASLYLLINRRGILKTSPITFGFILSHLLIALLGTAGRLFHFSFAYATHAFMILGFILIVINSYKTVNNSINLKLITKKVVHLFSHWPLLLLAFLAACMTIQRVISSDDLAYLAHLTNWQHMPALNFFDVYFGVDKLESTRYWIVSTPFSQAFLSEISGLSGLKLLSGYYEPYLAIISILCMYELAKTLRLSSRSTITAIALQITFLALLSDYLHPGAPFFRQLSTDKATAAFIFSPIFVLCAIQFFNNTEKETGIMVFLTGLSLSFLHPIIAAFSTFIVSAISIFGINRDNYKKNLVLIAMAAITLFPQVAIRLVQHEAQPPIPYNISNSTQLKSIDSLVTLIEDTPFYGFNLNILEMHIPYQERIPTPYQFLSWIWVIIPLVAALTSIRGLKNNYLKQYILATILLILLAGIPFTGWILGYFVSAWMLERTTWLYQFGISAIFLMLVFRDNTKIGKRLNTWNLLSARAIQIDFSLLANTSIWIVSTVMIFLFMREQGLPNVTRLQNSTLRYQELSSVGQFINNIPAPVNLVGSDEINDYIPALSWKAKVISYRPEDTSYPYFYSEKERTERWLDRQSIFSRDVSPQAKLEIIKKYKISFILVESYKLGKLRDLFSAYPTKFNSYIFGRYSLIETGEN